MLRATLAAALVLSACAHQPTPSRTAPRIDLHQHLLSPAGVAFLQATLPAVELPAEAARLIEARQSGWNDKGALAALYAEDSLVLATDAPGWLRGREAVTSYVSTRFARPYRITPVTWRSDGAKAQLSGYYTRGEADAPWHFGYVYFDLVRDGGAWRITTEVPSFPGPSKFVPVTAADLVKSMDAAGIERAVILSDAFFFLDAAEMERENDWTASEVRRFPDRLIAFCSVNPLMDNALAELDRCAANPIFQGLKLHIHESRVDLLDPKHVAEVRKVFEAANRHRLPILIHVASASEPPYGPRHADAVANQLAPAAPDVAVVIAHTWGGGLYSDEAMLVYADAIAKGRDLYFETSGLMNAARSQEELTQVAARMRQIGLERFFFGSDGPDYQDLEELPQVWPQFRERVPLTEAERQRIANNVPRFLRR